MNRNIKAKTIIHFPKWIDRFLWKLGEKNRKRILKFFGLWSIEDELYEILSDEIRYEIDKEIIERFKK